MVVCEKCRKDFKRMLEVRWVESLTCGAYNYKRFDSIDDLMRWVESEEKGMVILKVVEGNVKSMEGKKYEKR